MKFNISKREFLNALQIVSRAIASFSSLPIYSGIKIQVFEDHILFIGSDSHISIQTKVNAQEGILSIEETGQIVIESRYILEVVRKIESDTIDVLLVDNYLMKISGNSSKFNINGIDALDYPAIDFSRPERHFTMNASLLNSIISQTAFATSDKELKPVLNGVNFKFGEGELICVGTDSYRLARKQIHLQNPLDYNITIPTKSLSEVYKTIENEESIEVAISKNKAQFILENTIIQTRLIDGTYPDTDRLIPESFSYSLKVDAKEILSAIDRASFIKSDGISIIRFKLSSSECSISTRSTEVGSSFEVLQNATFTGDDFEINCNGKYVSDALKALGNTFVEFQFVGNMKPFIITAEGQNDVIQLVLPVKTYN